MFKFLWKKKFSNTRAYEKVKRAVLCKDIPDGGLKIISIKTQQNVFLLKWLYKITQVNESSSEVIKRLASVHFSVVGGIKYLPIRLAKTILVKITDWPQYFAYTSQ